MLNRIADLAVRRPKRLLLIMLLIVLAAGAVGSGLSSRTAQGGAESPGAESTKAADILESDFDLGSPNVVLLVQDPRGVNDPAVVAAGTALTKRLAEEKDLTNVASYWTTKSDAMRGTSSQEALVLGRIEGDENAVLKRAEELGKDYSGTIDGLRVEVGGSALISQESTSTAEKDASKAEAIMFPVVLIVLIVIFASILTALLPLAVALTTAIVVMALLFVGSFVIDIGSEVTLVATFLGLGLAIDYSLLFITRYREELAGGATIPEAIHATMNTVGRTVIFSATTLAIALGSLLVLPFTMFHSLALSGMLTGLVAAAATLLLVPALLVWMGPRINKSRLRRGGTVTHVDGEGFWHRLAVFVMRRPLPMLLVVLGFMLFLASPALGMKLRLPDEQVLPASAQSAQVAIAIKDKFDARGQDPIQVVLNEIGDPAAHTADIAQYAQRLSKLEHVATVVALTGSYSAGQQVAQPDPSSQQFAAGAGTYLSVVSNVDPNGSDGAQLVRAIRDTAAPSAALVGGTAAVSVDTFDLLKQRLPITLAIVLIGSFILLFLLTGSVLLPIKAIVLSALSLSATFGALVYIIQDGHLQWLVGDFVVTGSLTWIVPVMVIAVAFALSLDYAVFILSRITEEYRRTKRNEEAVAVGLERNGRVVSCAALLLALTFIGLAATSISYQKAIGIGVALAVLLDATLVRGVLVPAFMRLLGNACWWAPGPMRRFHNRFGISEAGPADRTPEPLADSGHAAPPELTKQAR